MKKNSAARRLGFDDKNQRVIEQITARVADAGNQKAVAQTVVDALSLRLGTARTLLAASQDQALTAETAFSDGQVATQTALNCLRKAKAALAQSQKIREKILAVYRQAYRVAQETVIAAQSLDDYGRSISSRKAKNEYISTNVIGGVAEMQTEAQNALTTVLAAVQASMMAVARADEAVASSSVLVRESQNLLGILIPPPAGTVADKYYDTLSGLRDHPLYTTETPSIAELALEIAGKQEHGLLYFLDAMQVITDDRRNNLNAFYSETNMELNAGQHKLDEKSRLYDSLQSAMEAAIVALG